MHSYIRRDSTSPIPLSPISANRQIYAPVTVQLQAQIFSNKSQFLSYNNVKMVPIQNRVDQSHIINYRSAATDNKSQERMKSHPNCQTPKQVYSSRRQSEDKENLYVYSNSKGEIQSQTLTHSIPNQLNSIPATQFSSMLELAKEQWKKQIQDEFNLKLQTFTFKQSQISEQVQDIQIIQAKLSELDMVQQILNKQKFSMQSDITERVESLEQKYDKLVQEIIPNYQEPIQLKLQELEYQFKSMQETIAAQIISDPISMKQIFSQRESDFEKFKFSSEDQILQLKQQMAEMNCSLHQSMVKSKNEEFDYSYKRPQQDVYDTYIKKYETFNKQVSDYLLNRKIPNHLKVVVNPQLSQKMTSSQYQNSQKTGGDSSDRVKSSPKNYEDSPMKALAVLNNQDQPHVSQSQDDILDIQTVRSEYKCKMSTITEKDQEDDEVIYNMMNFDPSHQITEEDSQNQSSQL